MEPFAVLTGIALVIWIISRLLHRPSDDNFPPIVFRPSDKAHNISPLKGTLPNKPLLPFDACFDEAVTKRKRIWIEYLDSDQSITQRKIEVYFPKDKIYVFAWCCLRNEPRTFKRDGILRWQLLDEVFNDDPLVERYIRQECLRHDWQNKVPWPEWAASHRRTKQDWSPERAKIAPKSSPARTATDETFWVTPDKAVSVQQYVIPGGGVYVGSGLAYAQAPILDSLRMSIFQATAVVNLLLAKWCEPPSDRALHLSTLIQQLLSIIAQHGGGKAKELWKALCESGPFDHVSEQMFTDVLHSLGQRDLITQCHDGTLVMGLSGEALTNHYDFYTAFKTPEEYRVIANGKQLGTIPLEQAVVPGMYIIFAGRRWEVLSVEAKTRLIVVQSAFGGRPPRFGGQGGLLHGAIRKEMRRLYTSSEVAPFLDSQAREFLAEGREHFKLYKLHESIMIENGGDTMLFPWEGDIVVNTLAVQLLSRGLKSSVFLGTITVSEVKPDTLSHHLQELVKAGPADSIQLATLVPNKLNEKHDALLSDTLLIREYSTRLLDTDAAQNFLNSSIISPSPSSIHHSEHES